jgi:hypothetical protein
MRRLKPDPIGDPRNPLAVYLLTLALLSGALIVSGVPSDDVELPGHARLAWGCVLTFGSLNALTGMFWQGDPRTGLMLKRVGFLSLVIAAVVYAVALGLLFGGVAFLSSAILLGFAWACALQYRRVNGVIRRIIRLTDKADGDG